MSDFLLPQEKRTLEALDKLLSPQGLAEALGVPMTWIYSRTRIRGEGAIPCIRVGKYLRFRLAAVLEWLKKQDQQNS